MKNSRNWKFDYIKGIACLVVICLHCPLPGKIGEAVIYGCRFSVPLFFMITGYYCESKSNEWIIRKTKDLLVKTLVAEALYGIWYLFLTVVIEKQSFSYFVENMEIVKRPVKVFFCGSMFNGVFWYLYTAIWSYLIIILLRKSRLIYKNIICILIVSVMVIFMVIGRYYVQNHYDINKLVFLFLNAIVFGIPMILTGMLFSRFEERITKSLSLPLNILLLIIGGIVMGAEFVLVGQYMDFHFSTMIISSAIFLFAFTYKREGIVFKRTLSFIGQKLSLWIYLDHIFIDSLLQLIEKELEIKENRIVEIAHPFAVILLSVVMALLIYSVKLKMFKKKTS